MGINGRLGWSTSHFMFCCACSHCPCACGRTGTPHRHLRAARSAERRSVPSWFAVWKGRSGSRGDDRALSPRSLEPSDVGWGQSWSERWSQTTSETTATCDRLLQLLGSGMGPAPLFLGAAIEQLEETCAECAEREDFRRHTDAPGAALENPSKQFQLCA